MSTPTVSTHRKKKPLWKRILQSKEIYFLILPAVIWYIVICYRPLGGLVLAFKTYKGRLGIWGSPWCGLKNFELLFNSPEFFNSVKMTLWINVIELLVCFPAPIILALMLNELRMGKYKKCLQTIFTFPNFLSWVIVGSIIKNLLSVDGVVNGIFYQLGLSKVSFLGTPEFFRPILYISTIWKGAGWSSIMYLAAISGIDQQQYEAAEIEGANRWQRMTKITLPSIMPTVCILLVLQIGGMMGGHFDQIFNLQNDIVRPSAETLAMYIYRITFTRKPDYGFSTAVSLFSSVVNMILLVGANTITKRLGGGGLMGGALDD